MEIGKEHVTSNRSEYGGAANHFLTRRLNSSYRDLEADGHNIYDAALYWRFLYEQYKGMGVVRAALEEMTCHFDPDIVSSMATVMDHTFTRVDGPFHTFEELPRIK